jgi:hypothetical protein
MTKRRHVSKEQQGQGQGQRQGQGQGQRQGQGQGQGQDNEDQSVGTSLGTQQLQHRASRNTESVFSQMLSHSK